MIRPSILIAALCNLIQAENLLNTVGHSRDLRGTYVAFDDQIKGCWKTCEPVTEYLNLDTCTCEVNVGQNGEDGITRNDSDTSNSFNQEFSATVACQEKPCEDMQWSQEFCACVPFTDIKAVDVIDVSAAMPCQREACLDDMYWSYMDCRCVLEADAKAVDVIDISAAMPCQKQDCPFGSEWSYMDCECVKTDTDTVDLLDNYRK